MTLNVYAALFEDDLDAVSDWLDAAWREADLPCVRPGGPSSIAALSTSRRQTHSD